MSQVPQYALFNLQFLRVWKLCAFEINTPTATKIITCGCSSGGICLFVQSFRERCTVYNQKKLILVLLHHFRLLKETGKV